MASKYLAPDVLPRMSLIAQYDDLVRVKELLMQGSEDAFKKFVQSQNVNREKWCDALKENDRLREEARKARIEKEVYENKWKHIKSLFEAEVQKRAKVEKDKKSLERQIDIIKEVLLCDRVLNDQTKEKLAFLSTNTLNIDPGPSPRRLDTIEESMGSILSPSEFSFDKTEEDLDADLCPAPNVKTQRSRSKRGRIDTVKMSAKKPRLHDDSLDELDSSISTSTEGQNDFHQELNAILQTHPKTRYLSEQTPLSDTEALDDGFAFTNDLKNIAGSTPLRRLSSTGRMNRNHVFCTKTIIRPESCFPCGHRIKFYKQALKCQDCRIVCHVECKDKAPLPCYPTMQTPTGKGILGNISDYVPSVPPFIPALIVHCLNEIESRGLDELGLYRVSGSEREVKELKEKFLRGKCLPNVSRVDIHVLCGTVKEFLRSLYEPLITKSLWHDFVAAAESQTKKEPYAAILQAVKKLPPANKDTLAFLIIHLKTVAQSAKCKMPAENIAKVFGPTIVGYSTYEPSNADIMAQTKSQCEVVHLLLKVPIKYWNSLVSGSESNVMSTPETRSVNRLGPITGSGYRSRGVVVNKTPLTPRNRRLENTQVKQAFFASPMLK